MKIKIIKIIASVILIGAVIAAAFAIKAWRDKLSEGETDNPPPDGFYDPDQLPDWDLT